MTLMSVALALLAVVVSGLVALWVCPTDPTVQLRRLALRLDVPSAVLDDMGLKQQRDTLVSAIEARWLVLVRQSLALVRRITNANGPYWESPRHAMEQLPKRPECRDIESLRQMLHEIRYQAGNTDLSLFHSELEAECIRLERLLRNACSIIVTAKPRMTH